VLKEAKRKGKKGKGGREKTKEGKSKTVVAIKIDEPHLILRKDGRLISPPLFATPGRNGANENKPATSGACEANFQFPAEIKPALLDYVTIKHAKASKTCVRIRFESGKDSRPFFSLLEKGELKRARLDSLRAAVK